MSNKLGRNSLLSHAFRVPDDAVRSTLHDASSGGELSTQTHKEYVNVAGGLATLVDTPFDVLSRRPEFKNEGRLTRQ